MTPAPIRASSDPTVSVVIVNYHTDHAIKQLLTALGPPCTELEIIIVDQDATANNKTRVYRNWNTIQPCRVLPLSENKGFAGGCNAGARLATTDYVLFLNSDAWIKCEDVLRLRDAVDATDGVIAAGPISNAASDIQTDYAWNSRRVSFRSPSDFLRYKWPNEEQPFLYHRLSGLCLLVKRTIFETVGGFDEAYGLGYFEDDDLCIRMASLGKLLIVPSVFVYHRDGLSFKKGRADLRRILMAANRIRFLYARYCQLLEARTSGPLVTVIVTTFNRPQLLQRALESIRRQRYQNLQVLVVNDGGVEVDDIVGQFAASVPFQVRYITLSRNLGKSAAINAGIHESSGKYIAYLDDDDIWLPDHALAAVNLFDAAPTADAVYFNSVRRTINRRGSVSEQELFGYEFDPLALLGKNIIPNLALVHRKDLFAKIGCFLDVPALEDWDFIRRLSLAGNIVHIPLITGVFDVRSSGKSRNGMRKRRVRSYLRLEQEIRLAPPEVHHVTKTPAHWLATAGALENRYPPTELESLARISGLSVDLIRQLRPDVPTAYVPEMRVMGDKGLQSAYGALIAARSAGEAAAAVSALIEHYETNGNHAAVARLYSFLAFRFTLAQNLPLANMLLSARHVWRSQGAWATLRLSLEVLRRRTAYWRMRPK